MITSFWIKIRAYPSKYCKGKWECRGAELRKNKPSTGPNEIAVKVNFEVPNSYFNVPEFEASIQVPGYSDDRTTIEADVQDNIAELISEQLGVKVHLEVKDDDPTE